MIEYTVQVPLPILSVFKRKLAILKRRCVHVGTPDPVVTEGPISSMTLGGEVCPGAPERPKVKVQVQEFTIAVEPPNLPGGWKVLGVVETAEDLKGNLIHAQEIENEAGEWVPHPWMETYRHNSMYCEHCGTERRRKKIVVLESAKGCLVQVGSTCLSKYVAGITVAYAANICDIYCWYEQLIKGLDESFDDESWMDCSGPSPVGFDTLEVLAVTADVIEEHGWLSVGAAGYGETPTRDMVIMTIEAWARHPDKLAPSPESRQEASRALEWIRSKDSSVLVGYMGNLALVLAEDMLLQKRFGLACSVFAALANEENRAAKAAEEERRQKLSPSTWLGEVKQRIEMELTLDMTFDIDGQWGLSELHRFHDQDGNIVVWFCSGRSNYEKGETYRVKATVKRHDIRDNVQQTVVNRVYEVAK